MTTYIAFLRGINVGGHNRMKMDDLRELCASLGLQEIRTYIQSGNAVFEAADADASALRDDLVGAILDRFGYDVTAMVLTKEELLAVVDGQPFESSEDDATRRYATFLHDEPDEGAVQRLLAAESSAETFAMDGRVVYSRLKKDELGSGRFTDVGGVLGMPATRRAWNVVERVLELAST